MYKLTKADLVWNRATTGGGPNPHAGDRALAALLLAHGLTMNGGVLHAVECLTCSELSDAQGGYRFYGLDSVADLFARASSLFEAQDDLDSQEQVLEAEYARLIPDDSALVDLFERHFRSNPSAYAPL